MRNMLTLRFIAVMYTLWGLCLLAEGRSCGAFAVQDMWGGRPRLRWFMPPQGDWTADGQLTVSFAVSLKGKLRRNTRVRLLPLYVTETDTLALPELIFMTRRDYRYARRRWTVLGLADTDDELTVVHGYGPATAFYRRDLHLVPQRSGRLVVYQWLETCCDRIPLSTTESAVPVAEHHDEADTLAATPIIQNTDTLPANIAAPTELSIAETPTQDFTTTLRIVYPKSSSEVLTDFAGNAQELLRLDSLLSMPIKHNGQTYYIKSIQVVSYTSPEGTYRSNLNLATRRAHNLIVWLYNHYGTLASIPINTESCGEDWDGLRHSIEGSNLPHANEILDIIKNVDLLDGREKQLMDLHGGEPYRRMLDQMFPQLRRTLIKVVLTADTTDANRPDTVHPDNH